VTSALLARRLLPCGVTCDHREQGRLSMTRWIVAAAVGLLMACEVLFSVATGFAGAFDDLAPGNQKAVRALFEAQRVDQPAGARRHTLEEIAARKQNGEGWSRIFTDMKSRGLLEEDNFGQVINNFNVRHRISSEPTMTTSVSGRVR
jgi:hypothetical protein